MRRLLHLLSFSCLFCLVGCLHPISKPPIIAAPPPPPASSVSDIGAHVRVDLDAVTQELTAELPAQLDSGKELVVVKANTQIMIETTINEMVAEVVTDKVKKLVSQPIQKACKKSNWIGYFVAPCWINTLVEITIDVPRTVYHEVQKKVLSATNLPVPLELTVTHDEHLSAAKVTMMSSTLLASVDIDYAVQAKAEASMLKLGLASCGVGETRPVVRISQPIALNWKTDGTLNLIKGSTLR